MTASWMLYAVAMTLLVVVAGLLLERPLRERSGASRKLWLALVIVALLWPVAMTIATRTTLVPAATQATPGAQPAGADREVILDAPADRVASPVVRLPELVPASPVLDRMAMRIALMTPLVLMIALLLEVIRLSRARRRWRSSIVDGVPVLISDDFGPAIVGVWRPSIVIPEWVIALPGAQRALLLAHESEHLAARDSSWLGLGFLAVTFAPWNPALWYLLRRFRLAMEVDCDRRVLRRGFDVETYATLLIEMGRRSPGRSLLAAGFAERRSMLRTRIELLLTGVAPSLSRRTRLLTGAVVLLAACSLAPGKIAREPQAGLAPLRPQVADSIVAEDELAAPIRIGSNLPAAFQLVPGAPTRSDEPAHSCPANLIDSRDGTVLRLERGVAGPIRPTPDRPMVVNGYYSVAPAGRYGVAAGELLRVGCTSGKPLLAESGMPASAAILSALKEEFGITLDSLNRVGGQLQLSFVATPADTTKARAIEVARFLWKRLGQETDGVDTVTVAVRYPNGWVRDVDPPMTLHAIRWHLYRDRDHLAGE